MRSALVIVGLHLFAQMFLWAQDPEEVFARANGFYQQNKFAEAREAYESLVRNGYESGALYYNLGNAWYRTGNVAQAILSYERGVRLAPNDDDLQHNLQLANLMTTDRIEPAPRLFVWDYWDGFKGAFSATTILWTTYVFFLLLFASLNLFVVGRSYAVRKSAVIFAGSAGLLFFFFLVVCVNRISDLARDDQAIVVTEIAIVKNSPDAKSTDAFVLHSGVKVQITDRVSEWVKIRLADGKVGWMEGSAAEVI